MDMIAAKLEELADTRATADSVRIEYESKRSEILKVVQAELEALDAEFEPLIETAEARAEVLEQEIKTAVVQLGATVKGSRISAFFNRGVVSWDRKKLEDYGKSHPDVLNFRKQGEPFVALRISTTR